MKTILIISKYHAIDLEKVRVIFYGEEEISFWTGKKCYGYYRTNDQNKMKRAHELVAKAYRARGHTASLLSLEIKPV